MGESKCWKQIGIQLSTFVKEIQYLGGGVETFLEAENEEKLLLFYRDNRFSQFDIRQTASDTDEPHELVQLLRLL